MTESGYNVCCWFSYAAACLLIQNTHLNRQDVLNVFLNVLHVLSNLTIHSICYMFTKSDLQ